MLGWGRAQLRPLPWRAIRDPWAVLVSEVMAQQTGVDRVAPKWHELLERWPTAGHLADAALGDLLRLWQGLGYPRRARNLHSAAVAIVAEHGGEVPDQLEDLLALPGVGPYTARAVLAFAFERRVGVVDTNVARVLARRHGRQLGQREAQTLADAAVPASEPWLWNQSIMEIGATCCRPAPVCGRCPLRDTCAWAAAGCTTPDPSVGSAGVSRTQARYRGSDREARGRILAAALADGLDAVELPDVAGLADDPVRATRLAMDLVAEGLVVADPDGSFAAP